jgi:hypothetical protein
MRLELEHSIVRVRKYIQIECQRSLVNGEASYSKDEAEESVESGT